MTPQRLDMDFVPTGPPVLLATLAALALAAGLVACWHTFRAVRRHLQTTPGDEVLTLLTASIATAVAMTGMWRFFGDVLGFSPLSRIMLFAFLELATITSGVRARRNIREFQSAGADGAAMWLFTGLSAVLSCMDARSPGEALFRLSAPVVAAWLWERGMAGERRRVTNRPDRIHWRVTLERTLIRIGLADPANRTTDDNDAHQRLLRVARAAHQVQAQRAAGMKGRRHRRALARLDKAMLAAVAHADLATDATRQRLLLAQMGTLIHASALAELTPSAPWQQRAADEEQADRRQPKRLTPVSTPAARQTSPRPKASLTVTSPPDRPSPASRRAQSQRILEKAAAAVETGAGIDADRILDQLRDMSAETSQIVRLAFLATRRCSESRAQAAEHWPTRARTWLRDNRIGFQRRELTRIRDERLSKAYDSPALNGAGGSVVTVEADQ